MKAPPYEACPISMKATTSIEATLQCSAFALLPRLPAADLNRLSTIRHILTDIYPVALILRMNPVRSATLRDRLVASTVRCAAPSIFGVTPLTGPTLYRIALDGVSRA